MPNRPPSKVAVGILGAEAAMHSVERHAEHGCASFTGMANTDYLAVPNEGLKKAGVEAPFFSGIARENSDRQAAQDPLI